MNLIPGNVLGYLFSCTVLVSLLGEVCGQCTLNGNLVKDDKRNKERRQKLLDRLNGLTKEFRNHPIETHVNDKTYTMKICPDEKETTDHSAFDEKESSKTNITRLGRMNESDVMLSKFGDTLFLIYTNGDDYNNACNKTERRTVTTIRMTSQVKEPTLIPTEESVGDGEDFCFYVFELYYPLNSEIGKIINESSEIPPVPSTHNSVVTQSSAAANAAPAAAQTGSAATTSAALSTGSIILIVVLVPLVLFFAIGSVYKRFVVGAQGWEQVPFIDFWRGCWSAQADGWRYVFGRRVRGSSYHDYSAVSTDDERQPALLDHGSSTNDDHLLPM